MRVPSLQLNQLKLKRLAKVWRYFSPNLKSSKVELSGALLCAIGVVAMQLAKPWPLKLIFDGLFLSSPATTQTTQWTAALTSHLSAGQIVPVACLAVLLISVLWGLFSFGQAYLTARAGQTVIFSLRAKVHSHLQRLPLGFHQEQKRGDLLMRLTGDVNLLRDLLVNATLQAVSATLLLVTMLAVLLIMDPSLTLVVALLLPILAVTTFRFSRKIKSAATRQRQHEGRIATMISETLREMPLIQALGRGRLRDKHFGRINRRGLRSGLKTTRLEASMARAIEVLLALGTAAVFWIGVERVQSGTLTPGDLLVFIAYVGTSFKPMRRLARTSSRMAKATVCANRVKDILKQAPEVVSLPNAKRARRLEGRIELRRVSYRYSDKRRAVHRLSLEIEPGTTLAIVGPSGAGKSTLLNLLLRLHDPTRGRIRVDGRDLRRYQVESLRERIGIVLQEPLLFGDSIRSNLLFAAPNASEIDIRRAVKGARLDDFVGDLPQGLDTPLAEAGASLSAGQRQRISIARAMVRNCSIMLLDEPTTGLDAASEAAVLAALKQATKGKTTVVVAHKLATIQDADQIAVLKRGRLVQLGAHEDLASSEGWYQRTWRRQAAEYAVPSERRRPQVLVGSGARA